MSSYQTLLLGLLAIIPSSHSRIWINAPMHAKVTTTPTPVPPEADMDHRVKIDTQAEDLADEVTQAVMRIISDKLAQQATEDPTVIEETTVVPDLEPKTSTHRPHKHHHHLHGHDLTEAQRDHIRDLKICVKLYNFYPGHTWYRKLCREILKRRF